MAANLARQSGPADNDRLSGTGLIEEHLLDQVLPTAKKDVGDGFLLLNDAPQSPLHGCSNRVSRNHRRGSHYTGLQAEFAKCVHGIRLEGEPRADLANAGIPLDDDGSKSDPAQSNGSRKPADSCPDNYDTRASKSNLSSAPRRVIGTFLLLEMASLADDAQVAEVARPIATGMVGDSDITSQCYCAIASKIGERGLHPLYSDAAPNVLRF